MNRTAFAVTAFALIFLSACSADLGNEQAAQPAASASAQAQTTAPCKGLPEFVLKADDATISTCTQGNGIGGKISGTVIYVSRQAGDVLLQGQKDLAHRMGLKDGMSAAGAYSATGDHERTVMMLVEPASGSTQVTINWGLKP